MSFIFTMRSAPVAGSSSMGRQGVPQSPGSLPAISEDEDSEQPSPTSQTARIFTPPVPARAPARALNRPQRDYLWGISHPPRVESPPPYIDIDDAQGPKGEKLAEVRRAIANNKHLAKRGGFKTLTFLFLVAALCIVGLVVGLVLGLKHKKSSSASESPNGGASGTITNDSGSTNTTFPSGSYSIDTYLDTVSTNCSSNAATWRCYPYSTYVDSPSASAANFDWIITPAPNSNHYLISSTANVFAILFTNISLALMNAGQAEEAYVFSTTLQKTTIPTIQLSTANTASTCYFNQTTLTGYLYTKIGKTYPNNSTELTGKQYGPWPYAVRIEQSSLGGAGTPTCVNAAGASQGDFSVADTSAECECRYLNTGT